MTNEEAAAMLERMKNYFLPTSPMLEERREITALDLAISALSKQSASCEQADHIADSDKMVDQIREVTKKNDFKPGDKFILELGQERRMFDEYEIVGTDLYVKTDLLEKLKRYEPISLESAIDYLHEVGWLQEHDRVLTEHSQPEKIPYKKPEIICDPDCDGFVCSQNGIYGWCPKVERWGCEYFYELERRNDG